MPNGSVSILKPFQTSIIQFFTTWAIYSSNSLTNMPARDSTCSCHSGPYTSFTTSSMKRLCTNTKYQCCPLLIKEDTFTCTTPGYKYSCKHNICCKCSNVVYSITYKICQKQYVGQTKNTLAQKFSSHFFNIRHKKQTDGVSLHFSRDDHSGTADVSINIVQFICLPPPSSSSYVCTTSYA